jgi:phage tail sheath gpL-like
MASNAVDNTRVSRVVGWQQNAANFATVAPNLPQRIIVIGEANTDKQTGLSVAQEVVNSAYEGGVLYGLGSPIHQALKVLIPVNGSGVGGIPVVCIAQVEAVGGTEKSHEVTVTGTATANATHTVFISGRDSDGSSSYDVAIETGDTNLQISVKVGDVISNALECPLVVDSVTAGVVNTLTKHVGLTADDVIVTVDTNGIDAGIVYGVASAQAGSGVPDIAPALATFGEQWNTLILNCYNLSCTDVIDKLEAFNGKPDNTSPTGQYTPIIQRPFSAVTGFVDDEVTTFTDAHKDEVTIALAPAPLSAGLPLEAAANMVRLYAPIAQNTPHLDVNGLSYPDMPTPLAIGTMSVYTNRDAYVKLGQSTVTLSAGKYKIQDFVTTHHPDGISTPSHRYVRNFMVYSNIRFTYYLKEQTNVIDKVIAGDDDDVRVDGVIKPKEWKADVYGIIDDLAQRGLLADAAFSKASVVVNLSVTNPDRLETNLDAKITGIARILPTTVNMGFNFGTL